MIGRCVLYSLRSIEGVVELHVYMVWQVGMKVKGQLAGLEVEIQHSRRADAGSVPRASARRSRPRGYSVKPGFANSVNDCKVTL